MIFSNLSRYATLFSLNTRILIETDYGAIFEAFKAIQAYDEGGYYIQVQISDFVWDGLT